jgi:hypothetical protein
MTDISTEQLARAFYLLEIAEKANGHTGKLSNLQSWAITELMDINAQIKADAVAAAQAQQQQVEWPDANVEAEGQEATTQADVARRL